MHKHCAADLAARSTHTRSAAAPGAVTDTCERVLRRYGEDAGVRATDDRIHRRIEGAPTDGAAVLVEVAVVPEPQPLMESWEPDGADAFPRCLWALLAIEGVVVGVRPERGAPA